MTMPRRSPRAVVSLVAAGCALLVTAGCSQDSSPSLTPSAEVFAGLDPAVVREVLDSKIVAERVAGDDPEAAAARYQNIVRNFTACRSALAAYRTWVSSGTAPELSPQPTPEHPVATAPDMDRDIAAFKKDLASGDITVLRTSLTQSSGCGSWIPAEPGNVGGPTIADVVNGKS